MPVPKPLTEEGVNRSSRFRAERPPQSSGHGDENHDRHKHAADPVSESLDLGALKAIALYLNFDMLASPNPGYFTYDGDQSLPADKRGQAAVPEGSAGIERTLVAYLKSAGKTARELKPAKVA